MYFSKTTKLFIPFFGLFLQRCKIAFNSITKTENLIFVGFVGIFLADNYIHFIKNVVSIASLQFSLIVFGLYQSHFRQGKIEAMQQILLAEQAELKALVQTMIAKQESLSNKVLKWFGSMEERVEGNMRNIRDLQNAKNSMKVSHKKK